MILASFGIRVGCSLFVLSFACVWLTLAANKSTQTYRKYANSNTGSRIGFAVVSNFLMALLVQAPSSENALRAKQMLEHWRRVVRDQGTASPLLTLAMTRLNAFYWAGLTETFCLPQHVLDVLQ